MVRVRRCALILSITFLGLQLAVRPYERPEDEKLWYGEVGAVAAAEAPPKPTGPAPKGGPEASGPAPPEGFTWGGTF